MVILPIPDQEVFQNVQLLPIENRTSTALFCVCVCIYIYIYICNLSSSIDKEPISLTYANVESNPSHQEAPTKLSDLKPWIFVMGFLANK